MGAKVVIVTLLLFMVMRVQGKSNKPIKINLTETWKPELGWELTCTWETLPNDTLQSLRLSNNGQQFMIYRPEKHGPSRTAVFRTPEKVMTVNCDMTTPTGQTGVCVLTVEPFQPPTQDIFMNCEVSGERPTFRIDERDIVLKVLVPPSNAVIVPKLKEDETQAHVSLNCSAAGLPAPNLLWTVGDDKVEADFTGRLWNATSKLWHVWSYLTYTPVDQSTVTCSPEIVVGGKTYTGTPAEYNMASRYLYSMTLISAMLALPLLR